MCLDILRACQHIIVTAVRQCLWISLVNAALTVPSNALANKEMRILVYGHFRGSLDPILTYSPYELSVISCFLQRITKVDSFGRLVGDLAKNWTISENGLAYEFQLSETSGLSAIDVKASLERALSPSSLILHKKLLADLLEENGIDILGPNRIGIKLKKAYPAFLYLLTTPELSIYKVKKASVTGGSGPFTIQVKQANKSFKLMNRSAKSEFPAKVAVAVEDQIDSIRKIVGDSKAEIVLGVPAKEIPTLRLPKGYVLQSGQFANPLHIELNRRKEIFRNSAFRKDISLIVWAAAKEWSQNNQWMVFHPFLLPPGLLPPKYYSREISDAASAQAFKRRWASYIERTKIKLWANKSYVDQNFVSKLVSRLEASGLNIELNSEPFREVKNQIENFDMTFVDGAHYFPDPDSYLEIWPQILPQFPFPGLDLLNGIQRSRFTKNPAERLNAYVDQVTRFEKLHWTIPLFNSYDPIIKKDHVLIPDNFLRPFDTFCFSRFIK